MKPERSAFSHRRSLLRMKQVGLEPKTIFDVGVATGTPDLYGVWDGVRYVLIDPLAEAMPFMRQVCDAHPGSLAISAAAGSAAGEGRLVVPPTLSGSSLLLGRAHGESRSVPIVTLDALVEDHGLEPPHLVKIDVQGFELEVLAGAERMLAQTGAVIAEVSLWADRKKRDIVEFSMLIGWLRERNFVLYDIAELRRRKSDEAITEMDLVFCPADSPLRSVSHYKTGEEFQEAVRKRQRDFGLA
jgi:FkbM family methyltransferase